MGFFHPMFTRNGMRNLKDIKRGTQSKKHEQVEQVAGDSHKKIHTHTHTRGHAHTHSERDAAYTCMQCVCTHVLMYIPMYMCV